MAVLYSYSRWDRQSQKLISEKILGLTVDLFTLIHWMSTHSDVGRERKWGTTLSDAMGRRLKCTHLNDNLAHAHPSLFSTTLLQKTMMLCLKIVAMWKTLTKGGNRVRGLKPKELLTIAKALGGLGEWKMVLQVLDVSALERYDGLPLLTLERCLNVLGRGCR